MSAVGRVMLLALATAAGTSPAAPIVDIRWSPEGRFQHQARLEAGQFIELCGSLPPGTRVQWVFEATAPLNFNIHHHVGKQVVYSARQDRLVATQGTLAADSQQDYCWMWSNPGDGPAELRARLQR